MNVLVTGGCGFVGSHVCEYYRSQGATVVAYDNLTKFELERTGYLVHAARNYNVDFLKGIGVHVVKKDIRDKAALESYVKHSDYIIHAAAQPAMTISWEEPVLDFSTNVEGTFHVLELARAYKIPTVSCATIHVYGNEINSEVKQGRSRYFRRPATIDERYPIAQGQLTPLHASKVAGDVYTKAYVDTYQLPIASFRLTGLYGPRQFGGEDHGWVANFVIRAVSGKPISIFGTGKQVRDILYVSDLVSAFVSFFKHQRPGIYNIGGGRKTSISLFECIHLIETLLGKSIPVSIQKARKGDLVYFACNTTKAKKYLQWEAKTLPKEGVARLIDWVKANIQLFE
jgi:CDP-paratose 2-epimerase